MTPSAQPDYGVVAIEQRDGVRVLTVQARQRGTLRPRRAVRLGVERHGIDTEIALLEPDEARRLAALLLAVAGEDGTAGDRGSPGNPEDDDHARTT